MGSIKVDYLIKRTHKGKIRFYWNPNKVYVVSGVTVKCPFSMTRLPDDAIDAATKAGELNKALEVWRAGGDASIAQDGHIRWLIALYRKSSRFRDLALATQKLYNWNFPELDRFRRVPVNRISREMALEFYETLVATGKKRKPSQVMQIARVLFQFAEDFKHTDINPFTHLGVKKAKPRQGIVTQGQVDAAKAAAIEIGLTSIAKAIQIGYDAGQRPGDIRTAPRKAYDGKWWRITQAKTGAVVDIPVFKMPKLKKELDSLDYASPFILHEERTNKPYSKDMLCRRVREAFEKAGIGSDVQFRDLRRACVVRMAEAGSTIPQICSITGHNLEEATQILKVYLPLSRKMAEDAADNVHSTPIVEQR